MVAYSQFVDLSRSGDSNERGRAAQLAAEAYLAHRGPADEQAALYAALIGFLDDPSVKVRAALAYGLLRANDAPRPIMLALLHDNDVIARAVAQYSPVLVDADMLALIRAGTIELLVPLALRERPSPRLVGALVATEDRAAVLTLLQRREVALADTDYEQVAGAMASHDAQMRGALLARRDLPARLRLDLVRQVASALKGIRVVKGAIPAARLERLLCQSADAALAAIGEREAALGHSGFAAAAIAAREVTTRLMIHAVVNGHILFFADCLVELSGASRRKIHGLLDSGGQGALEALFARCGLAAPVRHLLVRLIQLARFADLADDVAARHFVVTALTEELMIEHPEGIPAELEDAFVYLSDQNVALARDAARGVIDGFARDDAGRALPVAVAPSARAA